ncbi:hypothetical protein L1987_80598 [Smallanthus sonchifolius]|uniref:Uncharacterized protein n=1 Tax=Smallanthus sonchifolius TaxID=185202 RepID=A0ACB8YNA9_9ASTR|nr:hypothetical protein L1987_80598 [Smallanthus sonchifolius]
MSHSVRYYYSLVDDGSDPMIISGAPPAYAFPEVVLDLRIHQGTPLVDLALECDWRLAQSEIGKALRVAFASHAITHGQVWICYCGRPWRRKLLGRMESYSDFSPGALTRKILTTRLSSQSCNHLALMEAMLLTLREHLPSFKYASRAQLGDEVVDVENSSLGSGSTHVKIFPGNKSSDKKGVKRNSSASGGMKTATEGQSELTNISNPEGEEDDDDLIIFGVYKVDYCLFFLPSSSTFENFMEKINQEFELNPAGTYMIEYQVLPGEWYSLMDGTCLKSCVSSYRASENIDHIKLRVVALEK